MIEPATGPAAGPVIGILGGMGPAATVDCYGKLVALTPAASDQEHARVVIWADPTVPDRTAHLLEGGADPRPWLHHGARVLRDAGATVVGVPCNTAHAFVPEVMAAEGVAYVHMLRAAVARVRERFPGARRVGLLATTGTVRTGLYQREVDAAGLDIVVPEAAVQDRVMGAIHRIKAGDVGPQTQRLLLDAAAALRDAGAEVLIEGCTEIPLALPAGECPLPLIDPATELARGLLRAVGITPRD